jgi:hypothetical protein
MFNLFHKNNNITKIEDKRDEYISAVNRGQIAENEVTRILNDLPHVNFFYDVYLAENENKSTQIDHIFCTNKAMYVIEVKNYYGTIYLNQPWEEEWYIERKHPSRVEKIYNPCIQNLHHVQAVDKVFSNPKNIPVISIIAFSDNGKIDESRQCLNGLTNYTVHRYKTGHGPYNAPDADWHWYPTYICNISGLADQIMAFEEYFDDTVTDDYFDHLDIIFAHGNDSLATAEDKIALQNAIRKQQESLKEQHISNVTNIKQRKEISHSENSSHERKPLL